MIRFFDYFSDTFRFALISFMYRMRPGEEIQNVYFKDNIAITKQETGIDILYTRVVAIRPEEEPIVKAEYNVVFDYKDKMDSRKLTEDEILSALYDNAVEALSQIAARASLLIAQVTFNGISEPLVLPPNVVKDV